MYICQSCGKVVGPKIPRNLVTVETRAASYPFRKDANSKKVEKKVERYDDRGGQGTETVREMAVCPECLKNR